MIFRARCSIFITARPCLVCLNQLLLVVVGKVDILAFERLQVVVQTQDAVLEAADNVRVGGTGCLSRRVAAVLPLAFGEAAALALIHVGVLIHLTVR